jgi:mono/diheme cytochrome c family protein
MTSMEMPNIKKSAAAALLLTFLASPAWAADLARGQELVNSLGCKGCHKIGDSGGTLGPALNGIGKRMTAMQIRRQLVDPKANNPQSLMPSFQRLPAEDIQTLVDYLGTLKQ